MERFIRGVQAHLVSRGQQITVDGKLGPATVAAWEAVYGPLPAEAPGLEDFHGDLAWLHAWESHAGRPYWPRGESGITLDPGFDLGYQSREALRQHYGSLLSRADLQMLESVVGLRGTAAEAALTEGMKRIRISRADATRLFPVIAAPYWRAIVKRFPAVVEAPAPIQTVMLSLSYNRGPGNRELAPLAEPLAAGDWRGVADLIAGMQRDHKLAGIRSRRTAEAELIRSRLA